MDIDSKEDAVEETIKKKLRTIFEDKTLRLVLLFGSLASGKGHKRSDIDLGFLFDGHVDTIELTNRVSRALRAENVDVVDLGCASPLLRFAAAQKSIVLYEREPGLFSQFYSLSYRMYVDTKKLRTARDRTIERFLRLREHV